jgi:diadenosine tetraphosphatase ApaH/serine/threonine PP2A family protein phosphatase
VLRDPEIWKRRVQHADADIVCVGHSHMQFNLHVQGTVVLNPGSVGLPRDGDPRAAYAIIDEYRIELKRVAYPVEETVDRIATMPWPQRAKDLLTYVLRTGRLPVGTPDPDAEEDADSGAGMVDNSDSDLDLLPG